MIDTIVLKLNEEQFEILDHNRFSPSSIGLYVSPYYKMGKKAYFQCYQNPEKSDYKSGNYKPRLTLTKRVNKSGFPINLKIEFSAPKLLFNNNFVELGDEDLKFILTKLRSKLLEMGVLISEHDLEYAEVTSIHYSKNIILEKHLTVRLIMTELSKMNLTKRLDLNITDFRNEGHALRLHANSFEIVFYDKIKDMQQSFVSEKRAIESDCCINNSIYQDLLGKGQKEVLRMEVRLSNRTKIKELLKKIDASNNLTFASLMSSTISKNVLLYYWSKIINDLVLFSFKEKNPEDLYNDLILNNDLKPHMALKMLGALIIVNSCGSRGLRTMMESHTSKRNSQRMIRDLKNLKLKSDVKYRAVSYINESLEEFYRVCLFDYFES